MQRYFYTAKDERGKSVKGIMTSDDDIDLARKISNLGFYLTSYKIVKDVLPKDIRSRVPHLNQREVVQFTFQLATLIDSGLPLLDSLRDMAQESGNSRVQKIMDDLRYRVESGSSFKEALAMQPKTFSQLYISIVGAGEATGRLSQALNDLTELLEWQLELKAKVVEAATYPAILFTVMIGVVALLVGVVIPKFKPVFEQIGTDLPLPTQVVLGVSQFTQDYWYIPVISIIAFVVGYKVYYATPTGRYAIDSLKLKIPVAGDLMRKISLSRFTHTFSLSFRSGINLLTCLDIAKATAANARIENAVLKARDSVNVGEKLATSLQMSGEFPGMVLRMIAVGEHTGALAQTLAKVSSYYDKEVTSTVKKLFTLFEPLMIVIMGFIVGGIAFAIFLPMFKMAQVIGG